MLILENGLFFPIRPASQKQVAHHWFKALVTMVTLISFHRHNRDCLNQWFLTFFAPWTPKRLNKFHGPLKCFYILLTDPLIQVKVVYLGTVLYFSDLHGPPRPSPRTFGYEPMYYRLIKG